MYYNGATSYFFVNSTETHKFNTKDSEIVAVLLCLGNISEDFSTDNMKKKTRLIGSVCDFSVDYDAIAVHDILDIHKYLVKMNGIIENVLICKANICFSNGSF